MSASRALLLVTAATLVGGALYLANRTHPTGSVPAARMDTPLAAGGESSRPRRTRRPETLPRGADPTGIAVDASRGRIYWTEAATGDVRSAKLDGSDIKTIVSGIDRPVGVAVAEGDALLYWTTDGAYPRQIGSARLDGSKARVLLAGPEVNRPSAVAVDAQSGEVYWSESVAGRIRRIGDGEGAVVIDSGVSSQGDRPGSEVTWALGLAIDAEARKLYWTELTSGTIHRADLDGSDEQRIVLPRERCDSPAGLAVDGEGGKLYWADSGCGTIFGANLDGSGVHPLVTAEQGLVAPYGVAFDPARRRLFWTDTVTEKIQAANPDGTDVVDILSMRRPHRRPRRDPCSELVRTIGRETAARKVSAFGICLDKAGAVKAVKRGEADAAKVAPSCVKLVHHLGSSGSADAALREALKSVCPSGAPSRALDAVASSCFGESPGRHGGAGDWIDCVARAYSTLAARTVVSRLPRALEWIEEVRPYVEALGSAAGDDRQIRAAVDAIDELATLTRGNEATPAPDTAGGLPASGQTTSYADHGRSTPDDGALRPGATMRFQDNRDGTITDMNTGLMWEKKCDCPDSDHDFRRRMPWSAKNREETVWDWLARVNSEGRAGFGGYSDWRVPNVKELVSIVDYERFNPAVGVAFDGPPCGLGCTDLSDPGCSCTTMKAYWSSTSFTDNPATALVVAFHLGLVGDMAKAEDNAVRAVRGGAVGSGPGPP